MEGHQTAKWDDGTRAITTCYPSIPWGDHILTEQNVLSRVLVLFCCPADDWWHRDTVHSHLLLVNLNSNWAHCRASHDGLSPICLSDGEVIRRDNGRTGTISRSLLLLPGACCHQDPVWCGPFAWLGSYRVSIGDTMAHAPHYTHNSYNWSYKHIPHPPPRHRNHTGTENSQCHIPLHIEVDKGMKGFVYKQFK